MAAVTVHDVIRAQERIRGLVHRTPVTTSTLFNRAAGFHACFKCENLQRGGSFKIRGAFNFVLQLSAEERARGIVAYSSGNHAQAVAIAAAHCNVKATIVMPDDAPRAKVESTRAYGPHLVFYDRHKEDRERIATRIAAETGAVIIPPYDHAWIIAGQGTAACELLEQQAELDALAVPLGGGGLLSGTLVLAKSLRPQLKIYGVEPELANDWQLSLARGERVRIDMPPTIADGLRTVMPGNITFDIVRNLCDGVVTVSENEIRSTLAFLLSRLKILVEPSGVVAAAAALHGKLPAHIRNAGVVLSGGNIDMQMLAEICKEAA